MGKCRECKYYYTNETMSGLCICVNGYSEEFGKYTTYSNEADCEDCVEQERNSTDVEMLELRKKLLINELCIHREGEKQ